MSKFAITKSELVNIKDEKDKNYLNIVAAKGATIPKGELVECLGAIIDRDDLFRVVELVKYKGLFYYIDINKCDIVEVLL